MRIVSNSYKTDIEFTRPKTVLENKSNGLYNKHLDSDAKFPREEIFSKI